MKVNILKGILFSIVMLFCLVIVGCNNSKDYISQNESMETVQNKKDKVTAISILENGVEESTQALMTFATIKLDELLRKYDN